MLIRLFSTAACLFAMMAVSVPASAFLIDSFDDNQFASASSALNPDSNTIAGGMLGGQRLLLAHYHSGPNSVDAEVNASSSSLLNISLGADTPGHVEVHYNGGGTGFAPVDFTVGGTQNAILMDIPFDDLPVDITVNLFSASGSSFMSLNPGGGIFSGTTLEYLFDDFSGTVDFTAVTGMALNIAPTFPATDLQIDFIETTFVESVPEPSSFALAAICLLGLGLTLHKKRRS